MCGLVPVLGCLADGRGAAPTGGELTAGGELAAGGDGFVVWPSAPTEVFYSLLHRYVTRSTHLMTPIRAQRAVRVPRSTLPPPTTCGCMAMSEVAEAGAGLQATGEGSNAMGFHVTKVKTAWSPLSG